MRWDFDSRQRVVCLGMQFFEDGRDVEAVDEEGRAAGAACVLEEMEELQAAWVGLCGGE